MTTIETIEADDITADTADDIVTTSDAQTPSLFEEGRRYGLTGSYSPEDNKLRLRIAHRMPRELYDRFRFKDRGYHWAPKQGFLVAHKWTPSRHDFLTELCGEVGDEETTLADRAEQRSDRFVGYLTNRIADGSRAYERAEAISNGIPLGQPILVGHHSQQHAERDAARIQRSLQTAVIMWERAEYWEWRAPRVIAHAEYKERPDVRARRIEEIEAEKRRQERTKAKAEKELKAWTLPGLTLPLAQAIANRVWLTVYSDGHRNLTAYDVLCADDKRQYLKEWLTKRGTECTDEKLAEACPAWALKQVQDVARRVYPSTIAYAQRWINHCELRITYERAILAAQGASHLLEKKPRPKQPPLLNYRAPEGLKVVSRYHRGQEEHRPQVEMTSEEFQKIYDDYRGTHFVRVGSELHRVRSAIVGSGRLDTRRYVVVFLTDSKEHKRPEKQQTAAEVVEAVEDTVAA